MDTPCLNNVADLISKMIDYEDYSVSDDFFRLAQQITGFAPILTGLQIT